MQRIHQAAALFFLAFSAFVVWESWNLEYYTHLGPGAGFFPLWLGVIMGGLSLIWLIQVSGHEAGEHREGQRGSSSITIVPLFGVTEDRKGRRL